MAIINPFYPENHPRNDPKNYNGMLLVDPPRPDPATYADPEFRKQPDPRMGTWEDFTKPSPSQPYDMGKLPNVTKQSPDFASGDLMSFIAQLLKQLQSMGVKLPGMPGQGGQGMQTPQGLGEILGGQSKQPIPGQQIADQIMQRIGPLTKNFY